MTRSSFNAETVSTILKDLKDNGATKAMGVGVNNTILFSLSNLNLFTDIVKVINAPDDVYWIIINNKKVTAFNVNELRAILNTDASGNEFPEFPNPLQVMNNIVSDKPEPFLLGGGLVSNDTNNIIVNKSLHIDDFISFWNEQSVIMLNSNNGFLGRYLHFRVRITYPGYEMTEYFWASCLTENDVYFSKQPDVNGEMIRINVLNDSNYNQGYLNPAGNLWVNAGPYTDGHVNVLFAYGPLVHFDICEIANILL